MSLLGLPTPSPSPSPSPSPFPYPYPPTTKPVRKLSTAAASAISAGQTAFHTLASQVGGHPGVLASHDNTLIVKACLENERAFYEVLARGSGVGMGVLGDADMEGEGEGEGEGDGNGDGKERARGGGGGGVDALARWVPRFYGTLRLEGRVREIEPTEAGVGVGGTQTQTIEPIPESIVLENVSSAFAKPNIMDIKLGTVLYEEDAPPEKKERMLETASNTTSLETGVRLTGFQVYDHTAGEQIITPKSYGKSIKASDLPDGMRRFFPLSTSPEPEGQGLPLDLLLPIMNGLLNDIRAIRDALATTELRMVGGSLLIVYEADWTAARTALDVHTAKAAAVNIEKTNSAGVDEDEVGYDSDVESEEEDPPAYSVRLIDFAHTRLTPGEGPDEGVLKGVDTTMSLFEGRMKELELV